MIKVRGVALPVDVAKGTFLCALLCNHARLRAANCSRYGAIPVRGR
jgi:hypothetical protein